MGHCASKERKNLCEKDVRRLREKIRKLQEEIGGVVYERERENKGYEKEMLVYAFKEAGWREERKKLKGEVKMLRKMVEEKEEKVREMEEGMSGVSVGEKGEKEWEILGSGILMEQLKEERARRDEAVEKWKQLYLAIKIELDHLIQRTHNDGLYCRTEDVVEELKREVQAKEETIKALRAQLVSMEHEKKKRDRDVDILRQSLRIMSSKKALKVETCQVFLPRLAVKQHRIL